MTRPRGIAAPDSMTVEERHDVEAVGRLLRDQGRFFVVSAETVDRRTTLQAIRDTQHALNALLRRLMEGDEPA